MNIAGFVKNRRKQLGITQVRLSHLSNVGLATIQNIEMNKANPSLDTIEAVAKVLGFYLEFQSKLVNWDNLAACGAPLFINDTHQRLHPNADMLIQNLVQAAAELSTNPSTQDDERKKEALQALLLALKSHYPHFFKKHLQSIPVVMQSMPLKLSNRLIRLKRQAVAKLSTYL